MQLIALGSMAVGLGVPTWLMYRALDRLIGPLFSRAGRVVVLASLAWGGSAGLATLYEFVALYCGFSVRGTIQGGEWLAPIAVLLVARRALSVEEPSREQFADGESLSPWLPGIFLLSGVLALAGMILYYQTAPQGDWDAWDFWNHRARCLFRAPGAAWSLIFNPSYRHIDYPLHVPLGVVRGWNWLGGETEWFPWLQGVLFTVATVALLGGAVAARNGRVLGAMAGLTLLATTQFLRVGAAQYADIPLAFYFLATIILLHWPVRNSVLQRRVWIFAGFCAGLSAWTKNEGLMFLIIGGGVPFAVALYARNGRRAGRELFCGAMGAALPLLALFLFKRSIPVSNDLVAAQTPRQLWQSLTEVARYQEIVLAVFSAVWKVARLLVVAIPALIWWLGLRPDWKTESKRDVLIWAGLLSGYGLVFLCTPHDLAWHLRTAADRLLIQVWPAMLYSVFIRLENRDFAQRTALSVD